MKFFNFLKKIDNTVKKNKKKNNSTTRCDVGFKYKDNFLKLNQMSFKCGNSVKGRLYLGVILKKINFFFLTNKLLLNTTYGDIRWLFDIYFYKKLNFIDVFLLLLPLIKPPFVVHTLSVPKKLKKKTKQKYLIKILYKNDKKRENSAIKQLYYNSNNFKDNKFMIRLYKSILMTTLE